MEERAAGGLTSSSSSSSYPAILLYRDGALAPIPAGVVAHVSAFGSRALREALAKPEASGVHDAAVLDAAAAGGGHMCAARLDQAPPPPGAPLQTQSAVRDAAVLDAKRDAASAGEAGE